MNDMEEMGFITGYPQGGKVRVAVRYCTKKQFLAGSNVNAGGTDCWANFTGHTWKALKDIGPEDSFEFAIGGLKK